MRKLATKVLNAALLALLTAGAACGGEAPAQPSVVGSNQIRFDDPEGRLRSHQSAIHEMLTATLARVTPALPLDGVTISVSADASRAIGGWGVGGFTPDGRTVQLHVDPAFPELAQLLPSRLPPMLAHELHHAKRWRGPGYGRTLLEAMVSEGLADRFAIELLGAPVPPWSDAFSRQETALYLDLARPELDSTSYSHERWFFVRSATLPRWAGYTLGYRLVEAYQAEHAGASAAQLVNTPASAFRPK
ncbi:MAG: DUF2268 domain-containing putative Zn-dependent protease [Vicinamibacteria bacterium]